MRADAQKNYEHVLEVARAVIAEQGVNASLREIARMAGVGIGTLYRHFPTREALLEELLREGFDAVTAKAARFEVEKDTDAALVAWLREMVALTYSHRGVITAMAAAIEDDTSALHDSCVLLKSSGARLLARAQESGTARKDIEGIDLLALVSALAWLNDQAPFQSRATHLFDIVAQAILETPARA
jgi:AcrR family transcriptional regulator